MGRRRIKGTLKRMLAEESGGYGYRRVWDVGRAAGYKRLTRLSGPNQPST